MRVAVDDADVEFRDGQWEAIDAVANRRRKLLVVAALLRRAGSGPVLPLALADSSTGS